MVRSSNILKSLREGPKTLLLYGAFSTKCSGIIYLDDNEKVKIERSLGTSDDTLTLIGDHFTGVFNGGFVRVILDGDSTTTVTESFEKNPIQSALEYRHILLSEERLFIEKQAYSRIMISFPMFFINTDDNGRIGDFEIGSTKGKIGYSQETSWTAFPREYKEAISEAWIELEFDSPKDIYELLYYKKVISLFIASYTGFPLQVNETLFAETIDKSNRIQSLSNFVLSLDAKMPIPCSEIAHPSPQKNLVDYARKDDFTIDLKNYIENFDILRPANNIHATFMKYKSDKVYIDSQLSLLFAGIDSIYGIVFQPDINEERCNKYIAFLKEIKTKNIEIDSSLKEFLNLSQTKKAYAGGIAFKEKISRVAEYAGVSITDKWAEKLNKLRNLLAHGGQIDWDNYLLNIIDDKGERIEKVDPDKIALILFGAIKKYSQ